MIRDGRIAPVALGILFMVISAGLISANDAVIKSLIGEGVHPIEIVFFRNLFGALALAPLYVRLGIGALRTQRFGFHLFKNCLQTVSIVAYFWSLAFIPLADAAALGFMNPIYASIGAILFMREPSRIMRWMSIAIGFVGMLIIIRPGFAQANVGVLLVVGATIIGAVARLMTKSLIRTDSAAIIVVYMSVTVTIATFIPALFVWSSPSPTQWLWFAAIGVMGSAGHVLMTEALKLGDVTAVEPVTYTRLVWAAFFGFAVFGDIPGIWTWVGGVVIVIGAILLLRAETRERRPISSTT